MFRQKLGVLFHLLLCEMYNFAQQVHALVALMGRRQRVVFQGSKSTPLIVVSGIPQCSVWGPPQFGMVVNDVALALCSTTLLYTADLALSLPMKSIMT